MKAELEQLGYRVKRKYFGPFSYQITKGHTIYHILIIPTTRQHLLAAPFDAVGTREEGIGHAQGHQFTAAPYDVVGPIVRRSLDRLIPESTIPAAH